MKKQSKKNYMIKRVALAVLLMPSFLLASCDPPGVPLEKDRVNVSKIITNDAIVNYKNYLDETLGGKVALIKFSTLQELIDSDMDFIILLANEFCRHCHTFQAALDKTINLTQTTVFKYDTHTGNNQELYEMKNKRGEIVFGIPGDGKLWRGTPFLATIRKGKVQHALDTGRFKSGESGEKYMQWYYNQTNSYQVLDLFKLYSAFENQEKFLISTYSFITDDSTLTINNAINSLLKKDTPFPTYFVDLSMIPTIEPGTSTPLVSGIGNTINGGVLDGKTLKDKQLFLVNENGFEEISFDSPEAVSKITDFYN